MCSIWARARNRVELNAAMADTLGPAYYTSPDSGLAAYYRLGMLDDLGMGGDGADDIRDWSLYGIHGDTSGGPGITESCQPLGLAAPELTIRRLADHSLLLEWSSRPIDQGYRIESSALPGPWTLLDIVTESS